MVTRAPTLNPCGVEVMPSSSVIPLMLTRIFGATMSSFISESRSVPPARISALRKLLPSSSTACSFVVGLAYSNARIVASLLFQGVQHAVRRERQGRHPHSDRVGHGVSDNSARRNYRRLSEPDHSPLVVALARHHVNDQLTDVADPRKLVELHVRVEHSSGGLIHDLLFEERVTDAHD